MPDYIIKLIYKTVWELIGFSFEGCSVPSLEKIGSVFLEKRIFKNFVNVFSLFRNYLPLEKGRPIYLNKLKSPSPKDTLYKAWLKLAEWFWRRRILNFVNVYLLFHNYLPLEKGSPFIWTNLNPLLPRMLCAKFCWNWPSSSGEEDF